ncbi:hypothetical protein DFH08DRAFT_789112 [Mycena albidolilacea]|uniref:Glucose receptor Git3 N-terminal domain-containing protein n=1 Tax=Mycena albidolilacea TaxID=1033008 RepID=A0AAD6ZFE0_9AGAR|nr:hypothetical protein DFH08DRAFT_789112 [Mycena albidolilacea]
MSEQAPPPGVVCNAEEYARSLTDPAIHCLTRGQSIGLTVTAESGLVSLVAVLGVFILIVRNAIRHVRLTGAYPRLRTPTDVLILSLFFADLVQAIGAVMDVHWVHAGKVQAGSYCSAQGVVQQLGETSVAITTLLITIFTFAGVWWRAGLSATRLATFLVALVWLFVALLAGIGNAVHKDDLYESPTPYWCWIGQTFLGLRLGGEYVWFWLTLLVSSLAYLTLFLWARGHISPSDTAWWRFAVHRRLNPHPSFTSNSNSKSAPDDTDTTLPARKAAYAMIAYPASYCLLVLPLSIVRWIGFTRPDPHHGMPSAATFAVISLYGLSGAMNVALLLYTRPNSPLFGKDECVTMQGGGGLGRAPELSPAEDGERGSVDYSEFRARARAASGGSGSASRDDTWRSGDTSRLELGRLPSGGDGWDLPPKVVVQRPQEDNESIRTVEV